ncbi:hypothetical protein QN366_23200 [Pseudomonas sp. CCC3.2]|uniref:hypothetical protein n=1 Tax=unclassified Pseudomonas TaxID=196821 RepID=UPI002AB386EA|nr:MULTISPECIES: hypothetical protein [unclassified Pseudomonas]MDY7558970.1 hypothetical protein [Pseudomonas sp. AB6]MEA9976286.1 hypothetical protein [Pseudomonas sp. RTS4]MEB0182945.1 hypothetical protein [Pseudomonas sp. CCC3.2]MEB0197618.1 hypothetical protein [Pseudomonas sp. 5S4]MEB0209038.1 hypothetical protein [Pseudomonas sp. AB6]
MSSSEHAYWLASAMSDSTDLGDRLIGWNGRWLMMGNLVVCYTCLASQPASHAGRQFEHQSGCVAEDSYPYPWRELAEILSHLPPMTVDKAPARE